MQPHKTYWKNPEESKAAVAVRGPRFLKGKNTQLILWFQQHQLNQGNPAGHYHTGVYDIECLLCLSYFLLFKSSFNPWQSDEMQGLFQSSVSSGRESVAERAVGHTLNVMGPDPASCAAGRPNWQGIAGAVQAGCTCGPHRPTQRSRMPLGSEKAPRHGPASPEPDSGGQGTECIHLTSAGCALGRPD